MPDRNKSKNENHNALSLERMIENAKENIREAEISMEFADSEEHENLEEKNERRRHSIDRMKKQMQDEIAAKKRADGFK